MDPGSVGDYLSGVMSRLDDELEKAVSDGEAVSDAEAVRDAEPVVAPAAPESAPRRRSLNNVGLVLALVAMAGGILVLVMTSFEDAAIYSKGVDELMQEKDKLQGRTVRVAGNLVRGTLVRRDEPCEYRFKIHKNDHAIDVRYAQCVVPDTFRDVPGMDVEVTAEGKLDADGNFEASHIMAKCPSKYEMQERAGKGEQAPHADIPAKTSY